MGLFKRKPVLKCPYCREENREHFVSGSVRVRVLPSWPYLSVNIGGRNALFEINYCPFCGRKMR